jgi:hypothetical protein
MTIVNSTLVARLVSSGNDKDKVGLIGGIKKLLVDAAAEFALVADPNVDVARLPASVVNLETLIAYLRSIKADMERENGSREASDADTKQPAYKTTGKLKQYKQFACAISAANMFLSGGATTTGHTRSELSTLIFNHGRDNPPAGLSDNGTTMWKANFDVNNSRSENCLLLLVSFITEVPVA